MCSDMSNRLVVEKRPCEKRKLMENSHFSLLFKPENRHFKSSPHSLFKMNAIIFLNDRIHFKKRPLSFLVKCLKIFGND